MSAFSEREQPSTLCLFDVDGTLTVPRLVITPEMKEFMVKLRAKCVVGLVGGSDLVKVEEQMDNTARTSYDFVFAENGLTAFKGTQELETQSLLNYLGEENLKRVVNFALKYIADLDIPQKRGTFVEFRNGMLNISPIGRNCSRPERLAFNEYDQEHNVRQKMVAAMEAEFAEELKLKFSIGGQISFDVFPVGWDKTYCLRHVKEEGFETIHFFGDKTHAGGNDHEIFEDSRTIGHTVTSPEDTRKQLNELFSVE
eukprot:m.481501 g.481501  ORF g.481501 m.481501 type:complete len:255 (+) comp22191_c0_seq1:64-828(+)